MPKSHTVATQYNSITQTQNVLFILGDKVIHVSSYPDDYCNEFLYAVLDWTRDAQWYTDFSIGRKTGVTV